MFTIYFFSQIPPQNRLKSLHQGTVSPRRIYIFGANIDIILKSCKQNRTFFKKKPKNLRF
jgi:hypothetical protein